MPSQVVPDAGSNSLGEADREATPWIVGGLAAGVLGALTVALFFFGVDLATGRFLWTPTVLGSALLRGEALGTDAGFVPVLVIGYTAFHGAVFIALGLMASFLLSLLERPRAGGLLAITCLALFAGFELLFLSFGALFMPTAIGQLGAGWVAVANALSAVVMASYLVGRVSR